MNLREVGERGRRREGGGGREAKQKHKCRARSWLFHARKRVTLRACDTVYVPVSVAVNKHVLRLARLRAHLERLVVHGLVVM